MRATALKRSPAPPLVPPVPEPPRPVPGRPRHRSRRGWTIGLIASGLLHLILLVLASRTFLVLPLRPGVPPLPADGSATPEMQVIQITPVATATATETPVLRPEETLERPTPRQPEDRVTPSPDAPEAGAPSVRRAPAEVLRPRMGDPRIWARPETPPEPERTDIERARERVYSRLGELNDSLAAEGAAAASATDWTVKDGDGGRWGFSPGKIHLGGITLPFPFGFGSTAPPGRSDEVRERRQEDAEIRDQAARQQAKEVRDERTKAIRERKEKERGKSGSGTGTKSGTGTGTAGGSGSGSASGTGSGTDPG